MNGYAREEEGCRKLLDLIPKEMGSFAKRSQKTSMEDQNLELRLGPPGGNYFSNSNSSSVRRNHALGSPWHEGSAPFLAAMKAVDAEKKTYSTALGDGDTAVYLESKSQQKRTAPSPSPVVGWPPVRSFRKNLSNGNPSKAATSSPNKHSDEISAQKTTTKDAPKTLFVKINMDGIPIGRKVNLGAYDSYEKLSHAVDHLFRGLIAAQSDNVMKDKEDDQLIGNLLEGKGEYTLVYEDGEGDRMLVGDVPWQMFVSNVKRLRVLKSSELPKLSGDKHRRWN